MQKFTLNEKLELKDEILLINSKAWPEFMLHWDCKEWSHLFSTFSNFQVILLEGKKTIAFGHTIPLYWEKEIENIPDNLKTLIEIAVETKKRSLNPNILLALAVVIAQDYKGRGLSSEVLKVMKDIANKNGINTLIVPVRPTLKSKYPLIPISNYSKWIREDGLPFDPWLRVHKKLGGEVFKTSDVSMVIKGTIKEWEEWTKMKIYESGKYIFEGALNPVDIDIERNIGIYTDPCIWVKHIT
ncbi:MAG: GNAT family N-acetyltransferase [Firmicutes bacterium]|nr:GNAT family N-acetyltransferase [Bacillota bacterium]